MKARIASKHCE